MYIYIHAYIHIHIFVYAYICTYMYINTNIPKNISPLVLRHSVRTVYFDQEVSNNLEICNTLQHIASYCNILQHNAAHCCTLLCNTAHCRSATATNCRNMQHIATHCNTIQHITTLQWSNLSFQVVMTSMCTKFMYDILITYM